MAHKYFSSLIFLAFFYFLTSGISQWLGGIYFNLGPSFSILINAEYYSKIQFGETRTVTNEVPKFNVAVEGGLGEKMKLYRSCLYLELRVQLSLTKIHPKNFDYWSVGNWRNFGLILMVGYNM